MSWPQSTEGSALLTTRSDSMKTTNTSVSSGTFVRRATLPLLSRAASTSSSSTTLGFSIERETLVIALVHRVRRFRQCRSLPLSIASYILFIVAILLHAKVPTAYDIETGIVNGLIVASNFADAVSDASTWYDWAGGELVPLTMGVDVGSVPSIWPVRFLNGYSVALGGLRFAQVRSMSIPCQEDAALRAIDGSLCYPTEMLSTAPFGLNTTEDVAGAFTPGPSRGPETPQMLIFPFEQILNVGKLTATDGTLIVESLRSNFWIDAATRAITTTLVLYNGQTSTWSVVRWTVDFMRGGRTSVTTHVVSFPADPYVNPPDQLAPGTDGFGGSDSSAVPASFLVFVDLVVVSYTLYLMAGTVRRVAKFLFDKKTTVGEKIIEGLSFWLVIDYAAIISLSVLIGTWSTFVSKASAVRVRLGRETIRLPAIYGGAAHGDTAASIATLGDYWETFKIAAVVALIVLSMRLFKYFQFQPRLNVMTQSISIALTDAAHFALLFTVLLGEYE